MGINYTALQTKATNLLTNNGAAITFNYTSGADIDPATGVVNDAGSSVSVSGYGVATRYRNIEIDGDSILASDMRLICNNVATEPEVGWNVTVNSTVFRVMEVESINPAGTNVIYICQIRK